MVEQFNHDVCPQCGAPSVPAERVADQALRECSKCDHIWWEDFSKPPHTTRFDSHLCYKNIRQPFRAVCRKCGQTIYFDIDPSGTPGFNGDWGDGHGDYGCDVDSDDDSEDGNGHVPCDIVYDRKMYPRPE